MTETQTPATLSALAFAATALSLGHLFGWWSFTTEQTAALNGLLAAAAGVVVALRHRAQRAHK